MCDLGMAIQNRQETEFEEAQWILQQSGLGESIQVPSRCAGTLFSSHQEPPSQRMKHKDQEAWAKHLPFKHED